MREPTTDDVRLCYNFFLGRDAERDAPLAGYVVQAPRDIIANFLASDEFSANVVDGILAGGALTPALFRLAPSAAIIDWAAEFLPLSPAGRERLAQAGNWVAAFRAVLLDPHFDTDVVLQAGVAFPAPFAARLNEIADLPLAEVEELGLHDAHVTLVLLTAVHAPDGYSPTVEARHTEAAEGAGSGDFVVDRTEQGGRVRCDIFYGGPLAEAVADVVVDGQLLMTEIPLARRGGVGGIDLSGAGRLESCGPLYLSGWMNPLPGVLGHGYEVLFDGEAVGTGSVTGGAEAGPRRFLFAIPRAFKDGRTHEVVVRRRADGQALQASEPRFAIGVPALVAEWPREGLMIRLADEYAAGFDPKNGSLVLSAGMDVVGEFRLRPVVGANLRPAIGVLIPATALIPYAGRQLTASMPALSAEVTVAATAEQLTGPLIGEIEGIDDNLGAAVGWCAFKGRLDHPVVLEAWIDGEILGSFTADFGRGDLDRLQGKGFHGFQIPIPARFRDGRRHTMTIGDRLSGAALAKGALSFTLGEARTARPSLVASAARRSDGKPAARTPVAKRVTAIILTRNGGSVLDECLASVAQFTPPGLLDIVIVDHQSTDDTGDVVRKWQAVLPIVYEYVEGNNSFSFANNWAIEKHADTDYVLLLNNDIILIEDVVSKMVQHLDDHDDVGLVGCKLLEARDRRDLTNASIHHLGIQLALDRAAQVRVVEATRPAFIADLVADLPTYSVTGACAMMRREEYLAVGGLAESYFYGGEDVELGEAVIADLGKKAVCLNGATALHHRGWLRLSVRGEGLKRIDRNAILLQERIGYQMRKRHARGLIDPEARWATSPARFGFVVVEAGPLARGDEYFAALELGGALAERYGVAIEFVEPEGDWHDAQGLTHLVNPLPEYRLADLGKARADLFTIAWLQDDFEAWVHAGELDCYRMIWCSSAAFCRELAERHGLRALHVPTAANLDETEAGHVRGPDAACVKMVGQALLAASASLHSVAIETGGAAPAGQALLAESLAAALRARGLHVRVLTGIETEDAREMFDAAVVLGERDRYRRRPDELAVAWVVADPDGLSAREIGQYDAVAFASQVLADRYAAAGVPAAVAHAFAPAAFAIAEGPSAVGADDVVYIGDALDVRPEFIVELARLMPIKVIGRGWDQYLPMGMVLASELDDAALPALYRAAFAVLHQQGPGMASAGIVPGQVLDVAAAGGLPVCDWSEAGAALLCPEMFFRSAADAVAALTRFRSAPDQRRAAIKTAQANLAQHFAPHISADRIHELLLRAHDRRMSGSRRGRCLDSDRGNAARVRASVAG